MPGALRADFPRAVPHFWPTVIHLLRGTGKQTKALCGRGHTWAPVPEGVTRVCSRCEEIARKRAEKPRA